MKYIDIHSHLDFEDFDNDREEIIADMKSKEIGAFNIGTCLGTSRNSIELAEKHDNIWAIVGIHPIYTDKALLTDLDLIEPLISHERCVGIGECGMDFYRKENDIENKKIQLAFFEKQIELAIKYNKPLMIHCREAYPETLDVLETFKKTNPQLHAHFHFFTESVETAKRILGSNFTVSFTGPITFADYDEVVKFVPVEFMMVETDSPYGGVGSGGGERNL